MEMGRVIQNLPEQVAIGPRGVLGVCAFTLSITVRADYSDLKFACEMFSLCAAHHNDSPTSFQQSATEGWADMRILISAYACEPGEGSEPGVGWNWVQQISRQHEVWVMTRANNRNPIERELAERPLPNVHWVYFDLPRWACFWKKGRRGVHPYYYLWQLGVYFIARKLHSEVGFHLVHHVTFVNYWLPSFLALLPLPFVWGPVGGGESASGAFWRCFSPRGRLHEILRNFARSLAQLDPFVRLAAQRARVGIATTEETAVCLRQLGCRNVTVFSEAGLPREEIVRLGGFTVRPGDSFRLVSIGNLLHWKGFELGMHAFALFNHHYRSSEYWIIGDGPERKRLEKLARRLCIAESVTFWGALPRSETLEKLARSGVLLHPSLHDSGGWVCLEAMAAGRPVVCLNLGGPAIQVTSETGIKVEAISPEQVIRDLAKSLYKLASDSELHTRLSLGAMKRVEDHFNWERKGPFMAKLYENLLTGQEGMTVGA